MNQPDDTCQGCSYPGCSEPTISYCDACDRAFCLDHGTVGGDRLRGDVLTAVPSACWVHEVLG